MTKPNNNRNEFSENKRENGEESNNHTQAHHAMKELESVRESLQDVNWEEFPPSVQERYAEGERLILDALGEAEALHNRSQSTD